ncbi:GAF domain-containing protein [Humitalea sp. 24SJ18S-53]|uniref:GAF domain-containing protein n=1 Tax=Humitalea sp. 24SJ18S-53 TaxID=3422307 RepID=UPI003D67587B
MTDASRLAQTFLPPFGQADLSNCEREQIHLAGSIQPHGALLVLREPDLAVMQASANSAAFLGCAGAEVTLEDLGADLVARIAPILTERMDAVPIALRCRAGPAAIMCDVLVHRPTGGGLVVELEPAGETVDFAHQVEKALQRLLATYTLQALCDEAARIFRDVTGYDRVMIYRFDEEGHGEVFSEQRRQDLEPFLGNRYPASDIPQIARRLYERNRVRVLIDINYTPVPLVPRFSTLTGAELDMSLCVLRSSSPIHVQYLRNMSVAATLVASIMVGGRLWGLVSCHHYIPRFASFEIRAVCELLAEALGTRISALESFSQGQAEMGVRRLEQRMVEAISRKGDWRVALFEAADALLAPVGAVGAALLFEGQVQTAGEVPGTAELREIGRWLDEQPRAPMTAINALGQRVPTLARLAPVASGLIAVSISTAPGEYLLWFRPERKRMVTWGGDPTKPVVVGNNPADLSPRRSFAQWRQLVEGTGDPWTPRDLAAARIIGETVTDVVLQFRSVRVLIAQDQLNLVRGQVLASDLPVVICDPSGSVQLINDAFERLLPDAVRPLPREMSELLCCFTDDELIRRRLRDLLGNLRSWRGEVRLKARHGESQALLVRADPVFSAPDRVLGFVFLFNDLTRRKEADAARRHFQEDIVHGQRPRAGRLGSQEDLVFRTLLASVVENAQLAALEITDGVEAERMPELLESVRASVARTADVLEVLIWHARHLSAKRP